jgi:hypothetical protein
MAFVSHGVGDAYRGGIEDGGMGVGDGFDLTCGDSPARLIMSRARSTKWTNSSASTRTLSPVWSQPSRSTARSSFVGVLGALGLRQDLCGSARRTSSPRSRRGGPTDFPSATR